MSSLSAGAGGNQGGNNDQLQNIAAQGSRTHDDVDSQSSQTIIIDKVEWTLMVGNSDISRV